MNEEFPQKLFELIYRRAPSEAERARLLGAKAALGLSDNDEIWPVLLTLDHYSVTIAIGRRDIIKTVDGMHDRIAAAVGSVERSVETKADRVMTDVVEKGVDRLLRIVKQTQDTADRISKKQYITAGSLGGMVALLCLVVGGAVGYIVSNRMTTRLLDTCTSQHFETTNKRLGCYID